MRAKRNNILELEMKNILSKLKNEKGQATVEFALVAILLMILVFGIVEFGRAWFRADLLKNAANIGARTCAITKDIGKATSAAAAAIPNYNPSKTNIEVLNCTPEEPISEVTVTVSETFKVATGLIKILDNIPIKRTATYRVEQ